MPDTPPEPPVDERNVVRVVLLDTDNRVLLLNVRDLSNPAFGSAWELPGGGMEPGETYVEAAMREIREETGLDIGPDQIRPTTWRRDVSYPYRGVKRLQHEIIVAARLASPTPLLDGSQRVGFEREDLFGARWWTLNEINNSPERFYPRSLPALLPRFLAGETLEEPTEVWV
jgi:8-oxo-dGTP pyrophosphatase MutT (NUDIX family)